jgi:hypothetical protein
MVIIRNMPHGIQSRSVKSILATILVLTHLTQVSCSSPTKKFEQHLSGGNCEQALDELPENDLGVKLIGHTQQVGGTVASYAFTGASYTAEILWDVTGTTIMFVALCGPMMAAIVATNGVGTTPTTAPLKCLPGKVDSLSAPPLGRRAYRSSKPMRCPPLESLSQSMRKVAACFENRNTEPDLQRAYQSLKAIRESGDFFDCLPNQEQSAVLQALDSLQTKIVQK